ncbi:MAG TPA: porin family protein [Mucilaginibacter sp.]|jgi:hypothetical protein|nr:porin family protein [Mucilaginibacter sp.]
MRKYILSLALLIAACISARAQLSLGIKAGVNYSTINATNLNNSSVAGYQAGAFVRIGGALYLQPELYLSGTGGQFQSNDNNYSGTVKFTNLDLPILAGLRFGPKNLNFRIMAGPVLTSMLSTNESLSQNFRTAYSDFRTYKSDALNFQAGAGVDFGALTADLRYQGGLSEVNEDHSQRQYLWALSVGFKIL